MYEPTAYYQDVRQECSCESCEKEICRYAFLRAIEDALERAKNREFLRIIKRLRELATINRSEVFRDNVLNIVDVLVLDNAKCTKKLWKIEGEK